MTGVQTCALPIFVREEIYIFSIVFELTYFIGDPEEIVTEETRTRNIEKVMFGDYYANNLMRYVSSNHVNLKKGGEIQEPSGKGINYKNYMEVIFLYYLRPKLNLASDSVPDFIIFIPMENMNILYVPSHKAP